MKILYTLFAVLVQSSFAELDPNLYPQDLSQGVPSVPTSDPFDVFLYSMLPRFLLLVLLVVIVIIKGRRNKWGIGKIFLAVITTIVLFIGIQILWEIM